MRAPTASVTHRATSSTSPRRAHHTRGARLVRRSPERGVRRIAMISDADLIRHSKRDPDAFGELFDRHAAAVLRYVARRVGCEHTAQDLMAETFAQAYVARRSFRRIRFRPRVVVVDRTSPALPSVSGTGRGRPGSTPHRAQDGADRRPRRDRNHRHRPEPARRRARLLPCGPVQAGCRRGLAAGGRRSSLPRGRGALGMHHRGGRVRVHRGLRQLQTDNNLLQLRERVA